MPSEHTIKVAKIFEEARHKQGLTQSEVADKAGMHPNSYAKIERAESEPSTDSLRKLIKALKINPSEVL